MGKKSDSTKINDLKTENSGPLSDPEKIAECLNIHFTNVEPKLASEIPTMDCDVNPVDSQQRNSSFELKEVMISDVFKWLCRAMYGFLGLSRALYGYIGLCRGMYGYVALCICMYGYVGLCRPM